MLANLDGWKEWEPIKEGVTIDSGAAETVLPETMASRYFQKVQNFAPRTNRATRNIAHGQKFGSDRAESAKLIDP